MTEPTRNGIVVSLLPEGMAQVVPEGMDCRGDCMACRGCSSEAKLLLARNTPGAKPGDRVTLSVERKRPALAVLLRITLPIAAFALGFLAVSRFAEKEGVSIGAGILCGLCALACSQRRKDRHPDYEIRSINE